MKQIETQFPGLIVLQSRIFNDDRGYFQELHNDAKLKEVGIDIAWKQDNLSRSHRNVVRGLHYQIIQPQTKLVQVVHGAAFDVAVDLRRSSPTFGRHFSIELRAGDGQALLIPAGFAHGFLALEADTTFLYKVDDYYAPGGERTILWNDPELGIAWPVAPLAVIVSAKDASGSCFQMADTFSCS